MTRTGVEEIISKLTLPGTRDGAPVRVHLPTGPVVAVSNDGASMRYGPGRVMVVSATACEVLPAWGAGIRVTDPAGDVDPSSADAARGADNASDPRLRAGLDALIRSAPAAALAGEPVPDEVLAAAWSRAMGLPLLVDHVSGAANVLRADHAERRITALSPEHPFSRASDNGWRKGVAVRADAAMSGAVTRHILISGVLDDIMVGPPASLTCFHVMAAAGDPVPGLRRRTGPWTEAAISGARRVFGAETSDPLTFSVMSDGTTDAILMTDTRGSVVCAWDARWRAPVIASGDGLLLARDPDEIPSAEDVAAREDAFRRLLGDRYDYGVRP